MISTTLRRSIIVALAAGITVPVSALATNGYFAHGWGTQSKAMAGVATALPTSTLVTATNPAGEAFIGNSLDIGVAFFHPSPRGYEANADFATGPYPGGPSNFPSGPFIAPGTVESGSDWFAIPSFGYNYQLDSHQTIGVALFGNGGMNTHYDTAVWSNFAVAPNQRVAILPSGQQFPLYAFTPQPTPITNPNITAVPNPAPPGPGVPATLPVVNGNPGGTLTAYAPTGVNLEQLFIEVPYTYKFGNGNQSIGIAPVFAIQSFEARGLQPFKAASVDPTHVTNNGKDWSYGAGLHFGWYGQLTDQLAAGMSYRTKIWMTDLKDYSGLFADGGNFDIPAMFNLGLAYKVQPNVTVAFDYQHIFYDEINAISNSNDIDLTPCFGAAIKPSYCLGAKSGLGFGWKSMDVFKLGVRWEPNAKWKLFGGVSYNTELLKTNQQALFNVLTPATIRWHLTIGATFVVTPKDELNLSFAYMPKETIDGTSPAITQTQTGSLFMEQEDIEISWSHKF